MLEMGVVFRAVDPRNQLSCAGGLLSVTQSSRRDSPSRVGRDEVFCRILKALERQVEREGERERRHRDRHSPTDGEGKRMMVSILASPISDPIHTVIPPQLHDSSRGSSQPQRWRFFPTCDISEGHAYGEVLWGIWNRKICPCSRRWKQIKVTPTQRGAVGTGKVGLLSFWPTPHLH